MQDDEAGQSRGWSVTVDVRDVVAATGGLVAVSGAALIHVGAAVMLAGASTLGFAVYLAKR